MEQSPLTETNGHSASQETPHLSWNLKLHYHVDRSPPVVLILSRMHPVHTFSLNFPKIHSDIPPSMPRSSTWSQHCLTCPDFSLSLSLCRDLNPVKHSEVRIKTVNYITKKSFTLKLILFSGMNCMNKSLPLADITNFEMCS
jgi:hypothetical protein